MIDYRNCTRHQQRILRLSHKARSRQLQVDRHAAAGDLTTARALVRQGLLIEWDTRHFAPKDRNDPFWAAPCPAKEELK